MNQFVSPYQKITDQILAELEKGVAPWVKPWRAKGAVVGSRPMNFTTAGAYRGINVLLLHIAAMNNGWQAPAFATFKQIRDKGGRVKKGSKGEQIYFMSKIERDPRTPDEEAKVNESGKYEQFVLKAYTVFNVEQTEGLEVDIEGLAAVTELPAEVRDLCEIAGVELGHGGDRAYYRPATDNINLPIPEAFESVEHYKATAFHEIGHATGHPRRMNRDLSGGFGSKAYAFEELVAELSAAFLCMEFGVEGNLRHPEYIASWIEVLKGDNRAFYRAAAQAEKALDWIKAQAAAGDPADSLAQREAA